MTAGLLVSVVVIFLSLENVFWKNYNIFLNI